jgi:hypothetical protein
MLPFLKKKNAPQTGVIVQTRNPDEKPDENQEDNSDGIQACAQDLLTAIQSSDTRSMADAIKAAFEILDAAPHKEGRHTNEEKPSPHTYDAQKED